MKSLSLFLMLAIASPVLAQGTSVEVEKLRIEAEERARREVEQRDWETRIFQVKHAEAGQLHRALSMFRASIAAENNLGVLSVRAPKEIMPAIAEAIKMLDVPRVSAPLRTADLTIYLLEAANSPTPGAQATPATPLPSVLQPVVDQLKTVLAYKTYSVVTTIFARGVDGRDTSSQGGLEMGGADLSQYRFQSRFNIETPEQGKPPVLRLNNMQFTLRVNTNPVGPNAMPRPGGGWQDLAIMTNVDIPRGQQVVVGKTTLGDRAFILVMSAKFLD